MKLIEFLKNADKDEYIYIGAASAFLWIGRPAEIIEKLPELDADYIERIKVNIKKAADKIRCTESNITEVKKVIAVANDPSELEKELKGFVRELDRVQKRKVRLLNRLETRIPFGEREVRDVYRRRLVEPIGTVVVIKGREFGDYWTLDEVENGEGVREPIE